MTMTVGSIRKVAVVNWSQHNDPGDDPHNIRGHEVSVLIDRKDGTEIEKRVVANTGTTNLFFPADWTGSVHVTVSGSKAGEETAALTIT